LKPIRLNVLPTGASRDCFGTAEVGYVD
jgi:hypothetical protein